MAQQQDTPNMNLFVKNWQLVAYVLAGIIAATMAVGDINFKQENQGRRIDFLETRDRDLHDDVTEIKADVKWIRSELKK